MRGLRTLLRRSFKGVLRSSLVFSAALALTACAESQLAVHMAKQLQQAVGGGAEQPSASAGIYKIGKPYQVKGVW